jgi:hypothetical protein
MESMPTTVNWRFEDDWKPDTDISDETLYGVEDPTENGYIDDDDGKYKVDPKKWWD